MIHVACKTAVRRTVGAVLGMVMLTAGMAIGARQAQSQEYETQAPVNLDSRTEAEYKSKVAKALRGEEENNEVLRNWFGRVLFPRMTQLNQLDKLPDLRREFLETYLARYYSRDNDQSKKAHDYVVNELALKEMEKIANGRYHPAVRYNAMLLIGELNDKEMVRTAGAPAEPLPAALPVMALALVSKEPTQIDAVRVAALVGILRHAERESEREIPAFDEKTKNGLISIMLRIIDGAEPPGTRSPEGQLWMKRRAVNVLGALGDTGAPDATAPGGVVLGKLDSILSDDKADTLLRCDAAVALGRIRFKSSPDATHYAVLLADLAGQIMRQEHAKLKLHMQRIVEAEKAAQTATTVARPSSPVPFDPGIGGGPLDDPLDGGPLDDPLDGSPLDDPLDGGPPDGGFGGDGGVIPSNPADVAFRENYKVDLARRRLAYGLTCALHGLTGPYDPEANVPRPDSAPEWYKKRGVPLPGIANLPGLPPPQQKIVDGVKKKLEELVAYVASQKPGETKEPKQELQRLIDKLNTAPGELDTEAGIKRAAPPVAPVGPPDTGPLGAPGEVPSPTASPPGPTATPPAPVPPPAAPPPPSP